MVIKLPSFNKNFNILGKKTHLIALLFFISSLLQAQIKIIDATSKKGISFVEIYTSKGDLIGLTNIDGKINKKSIQLIKQSTTRYIYFNHLTYQELKISKEKLLTIKEIKLKGNTFILNEVVLEPNKRKRKRKNKYIKIDGFYRSYQINNDILKYYTDGVATYYLPIGKNNTIKNKIIHSRSFINEKLINNEKKRVNTVSMVMAGIPRPDKELTISNLRNKKYNIANNREFITDLDNLKVGTIQTNQHKKLTSLKIAFIHEDKPIKKKMFNYISIRKRHNGFAYFKTLHRDSLHLNNLLYHKEIRNINFKHKKDDNFEDIKVLHEFFVTKIELIEKVKSKKTSKWFGFYKKGNYSKQYWKEFQNHQFYNPLPTSIEKQLGKELIEVPNKNIKTTTNNG
ncbi:hypothetical protein [Tenacibaculum piscium]|uniref:hypothetical protein n=1 Tax=Tenacibaculum piscium TaxID=1458515 RepID=UPI001EFAB5D8|nr:hypothetical protein [Tenacibaculum piscium]MCG8184436.1 hypothetical protein [Tenacibaculum piscium]MCG8205826.1 hypothetical protein [Tenacibaculum piscium]